MNHPIAAACDLPVQLSGQAWGVGVAAFISAFAGELQYQIRACRAESGWIGRA